MQLYLSCTLAWVFSFKFAAYFQNTFPNNTWRATSVSWEIIFEKGEIHLDYDKNITNLFAAEQLIMIKISQSIWQKVGYFSFSQLSPHNNSDLSIFWKKNKANP